MNAASSQQNAGSDLRRSVSLVLVAGPADAVAHTLAYVTTDRTLMACLDDLTDTSNVSLSIPRSCAVRVANKPVAGDLVASDQHPGEWDHVDVLVGLVTYTPESLHLARYGNEEGFVRWASPVAAVEGTHPIVHARFGSHPGFTT
jgi:hypothetical protein